MAIFNKRVAIIIFVTIRICYCFNVIRMYINWWSRFQNWRDGRVGLRRQVKALISSEAWVRIPLSSQILLVGTILYFAFDWLRSTLTARLIGPFFTLIGCRCLFYFWFHCCEGKVRMASAETELTLVK
jgi:hypothetical protein